jgi:hypothetical protein
MRNGRPQAFYFLLDACREQAFSAYWLCVIDSPALTTTLRGNGCDLSVVHTTLGQEVTTHEARVLGMIQRATGRQTRGTEVPGRTYEDETFSDP